MTVLEILTLGAGLLSGPIPITVDLGSPPAPAELRLDGRTVCALTPRQPSCTVDFGPGPRVHVVEAVRTDASGRVVERAVRRYNLPGSSEAEARIHAECPPDLASCDLTLGWAHVRRLDPTSRRLYVGGSEVPLSGGNRVTVPLPRDRVAIVTLDVSFPDGRRASKSLQVGRGTTAGAETAALAVPTDGPTEVPSEELAGRLGREGHRVLAVETGLSDVVFVVEPAARKALRWILQGTTSNTPHVIGATQRLSGVDRITGIVPSATLARFVAQALDPRDEDVGEGTPETGRRPQGWSWLTKVLVGSHSVADGGRRLSDAVATAGLVAAGASRRRAVVLVIGDAREETSVFTPAEARAYLEEIRVPLVVWSVGRSPSPEWPVGSAIRSVVGLSRAVSDLAVLLESQRIVWLESDFFPGRPQPQESNGSSRR